MSGIIRQSITGKTMRDISTSVIIIFPSSGRHSSGRLVVLARYGGKGKAEMSAPKSGLREVNVCNQDEDMYRNQKVASEKKSFDEQSMIIETLKRGGASDLR